MFGTCLKKKFLENCYGAKNGSKKGAWHRD